MHMSARCQALSLPSINYGKTRMEKETLHGKRNPAGRYYRARTREQITQINGDKRLNDISTQNGLELNLAKNCRQHR